MKKIINLNELKSLDGIAEEDLTIYTKKFYKNHKSVRTGFVTQVKENVLSVTENFRDANNERIIALRDYKVGNQGIFEVITYNSYQEAHEEYLTKLKDAGVKLQ